MLDVKKYRFKENIKKMLWKLEKIIKNNTKKEWSWYMSINLKSKQII